MGKGVPDIYYSDREGSVSNLQPAPMKKKLQRMIMSYTSNTERENIPGINSTVTNLKFFLQV